MTSYRTDQVGEQVREEIMSIIRRDLKDPRIGFVSITAVRMSPDLRRLENLKFSPELRFELDPSIEYSVHISELLKEVLPESNGDREENQP